MFKAKVALAALEGSETLTQLADRHDLHAHQIAQWLSQLVLRAHHIQISMDGRGCWRDNVFIKRLWQSVKYEEVYLRAYETVSEVRAGLERYFAFFNRRRPHQALRRCTPDAVYCG